MDYFSSNSLSLMQKSMSYLWTKQAAISDNIVNAETPNYKEKVVTFEENLREKITASMRTGSPRQSVRKVIDAATVSVSESADSTRMDDNGVNVTEQMVELVRNAYQLQYVMNSISTDLSTLRTAVKGQ